MAAAGPRVVAHGELHELAIAQSILKTVRHEQRQRRLPTVASVGVRVGALSGVLPDALQFGFEALVAGTPLEACTLTIEHVPVRGACSVCETTFEVQDFRFCCPHCGSGRIDVTQGYELDIAYLDTGADAAPAA